MDLVTYSTLVRYATCGYRLDSPRIPRTTRTSSSFPPKCLEYLALASYCVHILCINCVFILYLFSIYGINCAFAYSHYICTSLHRPFLSLYSAAVVLYILTSLIDKPQQSNNQQISNCASYCTLTVLSTVLKAQAQAQAQVTKTPRLVLYVRT